MSITRIYQGRILKAEFENADALLNTTASPLGALYDTHCLFQDAINYHMVALAGMGYGSDVPIGSDFAQRIASIWYAYPKGNPEAETLQQAMARTLNLVNPTFEQAVEEIFCGVEHRELLPFVLKYIMDSTASGDGAIQQGGRGLLPKLCDAGFNGNFDFSRKERSAAIGMQYLREHLEHASDDKLKEIATEMDLSWAGVKTQPNEFYSQEESVNEIKKAVECFISDISAKLDAPLQKYQNETGLNLPSAVRSLVDSGVLVSVKPLAKNNKAVLVLKQCAILFMYYPCRLSADLLRLRLPKKINVSDTNDKWDIVSKLDDDPIILTRGKRGYVYKGFSALPCWETEGARMYEKEWDIMAFKEALKAVHGFDLKQKERSKACAEVTQNIIYMTTGEGNPVRDEESETVIPVLYEDYRYDAVKKLIQELSQKEEETFTITHRSLNAYDEIIKEWNICIQQGKDDPEALLQCVRSVQSRERRFGSQPLFAALCKPEYRCIWQGEIPSGKIPRSENILRDYGKLQLLEKEKEHLSEPVKVTAAEARFSPRQIVYSDLCNLGANVKKGCSFVNHEQGLVRVGVVIKNQRDRWEGTPVLVTYSAPRFVRDQIGEKSENWPGEKAKKKQDWVQPMLKALNLSSEFLPVMDKNPAVSLAISDKIDRNEIPSLYFNFPVRLNVEPLHKALGKSDRWQSQFSGGKDELLHLHWPQTHKKAEFGWWNNEIIQQKGFSVLSVDLGVRYAGAYSLVRVSSDNDIESLNGRPVVNRCIGNDGNRRWYGAVVHQGLIKLDGEGRSTRLGEKDKREISGVRLASEEEKNVIIKAFSHVGIIPWFADKREEKLTILALNDTAINLFHRLLSRSRVFSSWVWELSLAEKRESVLSEMKSYFSEVGESFMPELKRELEANEESMVERLLWCEAEKLRSKIVEIAEVVTNSVLPQQRYKWCWTPVSVSGFVGSGIMQRKADIKQRKIHHYFMGGISVARLAQLEVLRQCLQSMNRHLSNPLGIEAKFGFATRNDKVIDPCPEILQKIDHIREERVNMIAHEIVAQALGIRLTLGRTRNSSDDRGRDVYHGAYELIPKRKPVDFVVLENLSRYQTSTDNSRNENSTLMRWSHRQITAKVKQLLTEVFGIAVLETHAAYTSRFDYVDSAPGFRAEHLTLSYCQQRQVRATCERERKTAKVYHEILKQIQDENMEHSLHLYRPQTGGEFFIALHADKRISVRNADMNASANIAWRALAAPDAFAILHRVRLQKTASGELKLRSDNLREKAVKHLKMSNVEPSIVEKNGYITAFYGMPEQGKPLFTLPFETENIPFAYAKTVWGYIKAMQWNICHRLNIRLLEKKGMRTEALRLLLDDSIEFDDDLPM